jgi:hypothetical protein
MFWSESGPGSTASRARSRVRSSQRLRVTKVTRSQNPEQPARAEPDCCHCSHVFSPFSLAARRMWTGKFAAIPQVFLVVKMDGMLSLRGVPHAVTGMQFDGGVKGVHRAAV